MRAKLPEMPKNWAELAVKMAIKQSNKGRAPMENGTVILRRTFNQHMPLEIAAQLDPLHVDRAVKHPYEASIRYWRVMGPEGHRNLGSDLSLAGLKQWGIVQ